MLFLSIDSKGNDFTIPRPYGVSTLQPIVGTICLFDFFSFSNLFRIDIDDE